MAVRPKDQRPHVIVVEDEQFQRETLTDFLGENGYRASGVDSGTALRKLVEKDPPALVLLDLRLPGGEDGFALARFLRERSRKVGIIMVTASGDTIDQVVGLENGGYPILSHVQRLVDGDIIWAAGLDGGVVLSMRGGDFELTVGQDFSIGYLEHDLERVRLYIEESFTFLVLTDQAAIPLTTGGGKKS